MKRKITHVIISFLIFFFLTVICGGCDRETGTESGEESAAQTAVESENAPKMDVRPAGNETTQKDYITLQEELRPAVLQIFCGDYRGSGAVWKITEEEVTVVSSAHLLKNGDTCEVLCCAGVYYEAKVDSILEDCDIGFAVFPADVLKEDGVELTSAVPSERIAEELVQGEELVVYGSMNSVAGDFVKGYLIDAECKMQIDGYDSPQQLLVGGIVRQGQDAPGGEDGSSDADRTGNKDADILRQGAVDAGMSGSGVFDRQGKLLGILAGGDGESGFAAVPVWRIMEQLTSF